MRRAISDEKAAETPGMPPPASASVMDAAASGQPFLPSPPTSSSPAEVLVIYSRATSPDSQPLEPVQEDAQAMSSPPPLTSVEQAAGEVARGTSGHEAVSEPDQSMRVPVEGNGAQVDWRHEEERSSDTLAMSTPGLHGAATAAASDGGHVAAVRTAVRVTSGISSSVANLVQQAVELAGDDNALPAPTTWQPPESFSAALEEAIPDEGSTGLMHPATGLMTLLVAGAPIISASGEAESLAPLNMDELGAVTSPGAPEVEDSDAAAPVDFRLEDAGEELKVPGQLSAVQQNEPAGKDWEQGQPEPTGDKSGLTQEEAIEVPQGAVETDHASAASPVHAHETPAAGAAEAVSGEAVAAEHKGFGSFIEAAEASMQPNEAQPDPDSASLLRHEPPFAQESQQAPEGQADDHGAASEAIAEPPSLVFNAPVDMPVADTEAAASQLSSESLRKEQPELDLAGTESAANQEGWSLAAPPDDTPNHQTSVAYEPAILEAEAVNTQDSAHAARGSQEKPVLHIWDSNSQEETAGHEAEVQVAASEAVAEPEPEHEITMPAQSIPLETAGPPNLGMEGDNIIGSGRFPAVTDGPINEDMGRVEADAEKVIEMSSTAHQEDPSRLAQPDAPETSSQVTEALLSEPDLAAVEKSQEDVAPSTKGVLLADTASELPAVTDIHASSDQAGSMAAKDLKPSTAFTVAENTGAWNHAEGIDGAAQQDAAAERKSVALPDMLAADKEDITVDSHFQQEPDWRSTSSNLRAEGDPTATVNGPVEAITAYEREQEQSLEKKTIEAALLNSQDDSSLQASVAAELDSHQVSGEHGDYEDPIEEANLCRVQDDTEANLEEIHSLAHQEEQGTDMAVLPHLAVVGHAVAGSTLAASGEDAAADLNSVKEVLYLDSSAPPTDTNQYDDDLTADSLEMDEGHEQLAADHDPGMHDDAGAADVYSPRPATAISAYIDELVTDAAMWSKQQSASELQGVDNEAAYMPPVAADASTGAEFATRAARVEGIDDTALHTLDSMLSALGSASQEPGIVTGDATSKRQSQSAGQPSELAELGRADDSAFGRDNFEKPTTAITKTVADLVIDVEADMQAAELSAHVETPGADDSTNISPGQRLPMLEEKPDQAAQQASTAEDAAAEEVPLDAMSPGASSNIATPGFRAELALEHTRRALSQKAPSPEHPAAAMAGEDSAASSALAHVSPVAEPPACDARSLDKKFSENVIHSPIDEATAADIVTPLSPDTLHEVTADVEVQFTHAEAVSDDALTNDIANELLEDLLLNTDATRAAQF